jgi:hypothetical protein
MIRQSVLDFKLESTKEQLTAPGGLALLAGYHHGLGLRQLCDRYLPPPGSNRGYDPSALVESLVLMLQAGGQTREDLREWEQESPLMELLHQAEIPDPDPAGDWLRRMGDPQTDQEGLHGLGMGSLSTPWMPMLGFLFENPLCLQEKLREGKASPVTDPLGFYRSCRARMPKGKRIAYDRADSASYQADLINAREEEGVLWALTADQERAVKEAIRNIPEGAGYRLWI